MRRSWVLAVIALVAIAACKRRKGPQYDGASIAVGARHACLLTKDHALWCWGDVPGTGITAKPALVRPAGAAIDRVVAGGATTCTHAPTGGFSCTGALPAELPDAVEVAIGDTFACAHDAPGAVRCWAAGEPPAPMHLGGPASSISAGGARACAVVDGKLACFARQGLVTVVPGIVDAISVAASATHACAIRRDHTLVCFGDNAHGELGDGTKIPRDLPVSVSGLEAVRDVHAGDGVTCARLLDGTLRCWGDGTHGILENGTLADGMTPQMISGMFHIGELAVGGGTACALLDEGTLRCWGRGDHGEIGDGAREDRAVPATVRWW